MSRRLVRRSLFAALFLAFLLHNDLWLWDDPRIVAGLPVGLAYHVSYCVVVSALMGLLVLLAWPFQGEDALASEDIVEGASGRDASEGGLR